MAELTNAAVVLLNARASCCEVFAESFRQVFRACCRIGGMLVGDRQRSAQGAPSLRPNEALNGHQLPERGCSFSATTGRVEMDSISNLRQFDTAIDRAIALKSAYAELVAAVQACVIERLQAASVGIEEARGTLIADAVHEIVQDTIYGLGRDGRTSVKGHTVEAIDSAVRIVITMIRHKKTA
jgi:hypothetical protein